jgi:hypothetical protein
MNKSPILFLIFNRPESTLIVFNKIREYKPSKLYIAADGPRIDNINDISLCSQTREIVKSIDWKCEVQYLLREENKGCKIAVSEAINWFFNHEEYGIIIEDDCLPDITFFDFCTNMLEKYINNNNIFSIGGNCFLPKKYRSIESSYFFSKHVEIWGWATWRRAWNLYDVNLTNYPSEIELLKNSNYFDNIDNFQHWNNIFNKLYTNQIDTWDYQWVYTVWVNDGLTILPTKNLVKNIGFNQFATHTKIENKFFENFNIEPITFPLSHPLEIKRNKTNDKWIDNNVNGFNKNIFRKTASKIKNFLKNV